MPTNALFHQNQNISKFYFAALCHEGTNSTLEVSVAMTARTITTFSTIFFEVWKEILSCFCTSERKVLFVEIQEIAIGYNNSFYLKGKQ